MSLEQLNFNNSPDDNNYVIIDADFGSDDAWALLLLLKAEKYYKNFKVLAVSCVNGNTNVDNVSLNALRTLKTADRTDIPVYKGAPHPFFKPHIKDEIYFNGKDGFGDIYDNSDIDRSLIKPEHAVNVMYNLVCKYPHQVSFILVGPLTNFALCLKMYSDFSEKVKEVFIMGGNTRAVGNTTSSAEFNFYFDPEAASIVLRNTKCLITILPWETCLEENINIPIKWRFNTLGPIKHPITDLLNPIEEAAYIPKGYTTWAPCDAFLAAIFLFKKKMVKKSSKWHATVELNGKYTRGQVVLDHLREHPENVRFIEKIDCKYFKRVCLWAVNYHGIHSDDDCSSS